MSFLQKVKIDKKPSVLNFDNLDVLIKFAFCSFPCAWVRFEPLTQQSYNRSENMVKTPKIKTLDEFMYKRFVLADTGFAFGTPVFARRSGRSKHAM